MKATSTQDPPQRKSGLQELTTEQIWIAIAALSGASATAVDAASRHVAAFLDKSDYAMIGARLGFVHALALLAVAILGLGARKQSRPWLLASGWCFVAGQAFFSGSLYAFSVDFALWTGKLTIPGLFLLLGGWLFLFFYAMQRSARWTEGGWG